MKNITKQANEMHQKLKAVEQKNTENVNKISEQVKSLTDKGNNIEALVRDIVSKQLEKNQEVSIVSEKTGSGKPTAIPMQRQNMSTPSDSLNVRNDCTLT